ncbi:carboxy terminal-processing peptidase [Sessilibacter corallicola]|uniref:carboxy terminal-processing peptidase n=1 Tax=Sessilibacter corallicola TaxID=2904075 RepID=UPI001E39DFC3|nr:carboxy terminal-processing peptidase [Sessilibacter corallicola]MCE2029990.1 carboxy terminal-processing peptidase [Sessilibacter corallicola]
MHRIFKAAAFVLISVPTSISWAKTDQIEISKAQSRTLFEIVDTLSNKHYRTQPVNDELSMNYYDNLLDNLDPSRAFFLASDIKQFSKYETKIDDHLKRGNITPGYEIYNTYRDRVTDRLNKLVAILENPETQFDFGKDEAIELDRDENTPWLKNKKEADEYWRKRLKSSTLNLVLAGKTEEEAKETLVRRFSNQLKRINQQNQEDVFETLVNSLAELYDPHTSYFSPRTEENFNINMSLSLEGIGAVLQNEDEFTKVVRIVTAGPADKQGELKAADKIIAVGQGKSGELVDVIGWRLDEVVDLIRGPKGSTVRLQVIPSEASTESDTKTITIKRNKVKLEEQGAKKAILDVKDKDGSAYRFGIIDIPAFYLDFEGYRRREPDYKSTTNDVRRLLKELEAENVDGIILDLRNNGGGSLTEATALTDLFIDVGPVVQIRETSQEISRRNRSRRKATYRGPLVVMINRLSASASEIFAGAIQDYNRGLIVGTQSFGKGTVQTLTRVHEGQLKITESKFYRVSGDSTQHRGVIPDIMLPQVIDPDEVGESTYETALEWDQIHPVRHDKYINFSQLLPILKEQHNSRIDQDPDLNFIADSYDLAQENRDQKELSLNIKQRKQEKKDRENTLLELENKRRVAKGEEPFKTFDDLKDHDSKENEEAVASVEINTDDALLKESGQILADFITLRSRNKTAATDNFGNGFQ